MSGEKRPPPDMDSRGPAWDISTIGATRTARSG